MLKMIIDDSESTGTRFDFEDEYADDFKMLLSICLDQRKNIQISYFEEEQE